MKASLHIHLGNSPELLAELLAQELAQSRTEDPMAPLHVGVGQRGMERMVQETIAHTQGIAANLRTYFPTNLLYRAAYALSEDSGFDFDDAREVTWTPRLLQWAVYAELVTADIGGEAHGDIYDPLRQWLRQARGPSKRSTHRLMMALAAQLARVFDAYNLDRPEWHKEWVEEAVEKQLQLFNEGGPRVVPATLAWQPQLWRDVHLRLAGETPSPVALLYQILHASDGAKARFRRIMPALHLFGMEHIHRLQREFIQALSSIIPVHLYAASPTSAWWQDVRIVNATTDGVSPLLVRFGEHTRYLHDSLVQMVDNAPKGASQQDHYVLPTADHALAHLQRGIIAPDGDAIAPYQAEAQDASLSFHASHGALRQVEVLHDAILACIERDNSLQPSDFVVLCPQLSTFAPLVEAVFRTTEPTLPYRIEDRSLVHANPVARTTQLLLSMADERPNAAMLLELLSQKVVQRRFDIDEEDKDRIQRWLQDLDVRWGWNVETRTAEGRPGHTTSTWETALRRIALGVCTGRDAFGDDALVAGEVAYSDVGMDALHTAGKFTRFVRETFAILNTLKQERTVEQWCELFLGDGEDQQPSIFARLVHIEGSQSKQLDQVMQKLRDLREHTTASKLRDTPLDADAFRTWLAHDLEDDTGVALTGQGAVSFARLSAARFASARVVFLLGMDDGAFPRPAQLPSWDLRQLNRRERDHSDREEDLYAMLQAFLLAKDHFGILWQAVDPTTGKERPPALPVLEFQRQLEALIDDGKHFIADRTVHHRMQPYSIDAFVEHTTHPLAAPFTYQHAWAHAALQGAKASQKGDAPSIPPDYLLPHDVFTGDLSVDMLATRLRNPERTFLRDVSNLSVEAPDFRLKHDDAGHPTALEKFSHYRALVRLAERSIERTGTFNANNLPKDLTHRLRLDASTRPGKLGEATLETQLQGITLQALNTLAACRRARISPKRHAWSEHNRDLHFIDTHLWTLPNGQRVGCDILYGKAHWDNLFEPWAKLCMDAHTQDQTTERVVTQIHDATRSFLWKTTPEIAREWLRYASYLHADLWQQSPAWSKVLVRSLTGSPQSALSTLEDILSEEATKSITRLYAHANEKWMAAVSMGGPDVWARRLHGEQRIWRPVFDPKADEHDLDAAEVLHTLFRPILNAYRDATNINDLSAPQELRHV